MIFYLVSARENLLMISGLSHHAFETVYTSLYGKYYFLIVESMCCTAHRMWRETIFTMLRQQSIGLQYGHIYTVPD
jgi:hypothetical protein